MVCLIELNTNSKYYYIMSINDELNAFLEEVKNDKLAEEEMRARIATMSDDEVLRLLKITNPGGPVVNKECFTFSITNYSMEFQKRITATAMISYMMRACKEYLVPANVPAGDVDECIRDPSKLECPAHITDPAGRAAWAEYKATFEKRRAVQEFLTHVFSFNPDLHVAAAMNTNKHNPEQRLPDLPQIREIINERKNTINKNETRREYEYSQSDLSDPALFSAEEIEMYKMIPPLDTFVKFDRYFDEHFEGLMKATKNIYGVRNDIDFGLVIYDKHATPEDAQKFRSMNNETFIAPVSEITAGRWALLGPYRKNREVVSFLSRQTDLLKQMLDQRESDSKIAADIVKKRVKRTKDENVRRDGPDHQAVREYLAANRPAIADMGAEPVEDVKDDGKHVEVDVFNISGGGATMQREKIYNLSEAPAVKK